MKRTKWSFYPLNRLKSNKTVYPLKIVKWNCIFHKFKFKTTNVNQFVDLIMKYFKFVIHVTSENPESWNFLNLSEFKIVNFRGLEFWSLDLDLCRFQTSQQKWLLDRLNKKQCCSITYVDNILIVKIGDKYTQELTTVCFRQHFLKPDDVVDCKSQIVYKNSTTDS